MKQQQRIGLGKVVKTKPPGITPCRDGQFSTLPQVPGVCSYHGGSMLTVRKRKPAPAGVAPMPEPQAFSVVPENMPLLLPAPAPTPPAGVAPMPEPAAAIPAPETLPASKELPENYWKIDENGKAELHFDYSTYKGLPYEDKQEIKKYYLWSRPRTAWVSKGAFNTWGAQGIVKKLNLPLVGKDQRLTFEESVERSIENAERRAERRERQAGKAEARAQHLMRERERYRGDISFWTQPNVNSSGGRAFTRQRERIIENYFKGLSQIEAADRLRDMAADAAASAKKSEYKDPGYVMRKIKEAEKDFKTLFNWVPAHMEKAAQSGDEEAMIKAEAYQDRMNQAAQKMAFFMQIWDDLQAQGKVYDKERLKGATYVRAGRSNWYKVYRLNPTTVTHSWFVGNWKTPYSEIQDAVYEGEAYTVQETHVKGNYVVVRNAAVSGITTTKPPGRTPCRDGRYSTLPQAPGVCSYHGGSMLTVRQRAGVAPMPKPRQAPPSIPPDQRRAMYGRPKPLPMAEVAPVPAGVAPVPQQSTVDSRVLIVRPGVAPIPKAEAAPGIQMIPVQAISVRRDWFQNRATPYSERSVQNIVDAVQSGNFFWVNFDPVSLWAAPDGKIYMLSGHSRLEAFERLCKMGARADGRDFCHIPAKLEANLTLEQAKAVALQSNTLSTKETDLERSEYYRKLRGQGTAEATIKEEAKRLEGQNWTTVLAISHLNPAGKAMNALRALEKADATSRTNAYTIARWIGNARAAVKSLTNRHEDEIYDWLVTGRGYGTKAGQVSNEKEFSQRLTSIINRRTEFGVLAESLNIQSNITLSPVERQYREQVEAAADTVKTLQKQLDEKIKEYRARGAGEAEIVQLTQGIQANLTRARIAYQNLLQKKSDVTQYARQEKGLFDNLNGIPMRIKIYGDNVYSYEEYAKKAAYNYRRTTGKDVDYVVIKDVGEVFFQIYRNDDHVGSYYLQNGRVMRNWTDTPRLRGFSGNKFAQNCNYYL